MLANPWTESAVDAADPLEYFNEMLDGRAIADSMSIFLQQAEEHSVELFHIRNYNKKLLQKCRSVSTKFNCLLF